MDREPRGGERRRREQGGGKPAGGDAHANNSCVRRHRVEVERGEIPVRRIVLVLLVLTGCSRLDRRETTGAAAPGERATPG